MKKVFVYFALCFVHIAGALASTDAVSTPEWLIIDASTAKLQTSSDEDGVILSATYTTVADLETLLKEIMKAQLETVKHVKIGGKDTILTDISIILNNVYVLTPNVESVILHDCNVNCSHIRPFVTALVSLLTSDAASTNLKTIDLRQTNISYLASWLIPAKAKILERSDIKLLYSS